MTTVGVSSMLAVGVGSMITVGLFTDCSCFVALAILIFSLAMTS